MNVKLLSLLSVVLIIGLVPAILSDALDAESSDPEWRDPPSADYTIEIIQDLTFKSNDPEYTLYLVAADDYVGSSEENAAVSSDSYDDLAEFIKRVRNIGTSGVHTVVDDATSDGWTDAVVPSWINASIVQDSALFGDHADGISITIMPALQQVAEDTHGEYWIYYSTTQSGPGVTTNTKTFLFTFSVDVEWNGGVIVPDTYNRFIACIDWGDGYVQNLTPVTFVSTVTSASFSVPEAPEREGFVLKGISTVPNGSLISGDLVVSVNGSNVTVSDDGDGGKVYTGMFYAVWEQEHLVIPTFWDGLIELFSNPVILLVGLILFLAVCLFIRNRIGGYA